MRHPTQRRTANREFRFTNRLVARVIACGLIFVLAGLARAGSATWDLNPGSGDWNTAANWTPATVPNGSADVASFGLSNTTDVSISADTEVNAIVFTSAATKSYNITLNDEINLTLSGAGIRNDSGIAQTFVMKGGDGFSTPPSQMHFTNAASAGNATIRDFQPSTGFIGPIVTFSNHSTAGGANVDFFLGSINFFDSSNAGTMSFNSDIGFISFSDHASAGHASLSSFNGGIVFSGNSTASSADISFDDTGGRGIDFGDSSTAGNAHISLGANELSFGDSSCAGSATIIANSFVTGTSIGFFGSSSGGTAQIELVGGDFDSSILDISFHDAPGVTIGSLAGSGATLVDLGANNLTVGTNNLSTTFSGVIQDGFGGGRIGGSLTKIGTGTLVLSGANTYTGNTNINRGVLQVDGSITSNTFVNRSGTLTGTGTINGSVTNSGKVSPGNPLGSLTVNGNFTQQPSGTLLIDIAGLGADQSSLLNVLGTAELNGVLNPVLLNGFVPAVGDSFTFLDYASFSGSLFIHDRNIDDAMEHWLVTYFPDHAVLSVVAGNVSVPDGASAAILLGLSLFAILIYRSIVRESRSA